MGRICVNQFTDQDAPSSIPRCVADWAHVTEQVVIALGLWGLLLVVAGSWTLVSRRQRRRLRPDEIGFSLKYRRWARTSRTAAILNRPVQLLTSMTIFFFMINRCASYEVSTVSYYCLTVLYLIAIVDDGVRFLAARYKVLFCFAPLTLLEILMIAGHVQVGWGSTKMVGGVPTRSWLDFSIMRPIFILRSYLEMERHVPRASRMWMMGRLAIKVLLLIVFGASTMFYLETLGEMPFFQDNGFAHLYACDGGGVTRNVTACQTETWSIMFSFYFTVVTLGTVGYGDMAPKTVLSRLLALMFIVMGVIIFSMEIENLINLYRSRQIGNPAYKPKPESRHVVIMGNPSFAQLSSILRELFHEDHASAEEGARLHAVILGERKSKFTKGLVAKLEADPIFAARVTYVAGNATRVEDLERALTHNAEAVFVFPDKLSDDPSNEDAVNIMRVLATRRYCGPSVRCLVMVLRAESARHMLAAGVHRDDVICENIVKMGTLAQSTLSNGVSTMLSNLAASLSIDTSPQEPQTERKLLDLREAFKEKTTGQSDLRMSTLADDASTLSRKRHWLKEYYQGAAKEMYLIKLSKKYAGLTFAEASGRIFTETAGNVILIAVEVIFSGTNEAHSSAQASESRVLLNPGSSLIMAEWMQCYVIADDLANVFDHNICPDEVTREDIMRPGATPTVLNALADTFLDNATEKGSFFESDFHEDGEGFRNVTAYAPLSTPHNRFVPDPITEEIHLRSRRDHGHAPESVVLDRSLRSVALDFRDNSDCGPGAFMNETSIAAAPYTRPMSGSITSDTPPRNLEPPPLGVLLDPHHIVICSFLGEDAIASLEWFIVPLRSVYTEQPPITILDAAEPSTAIVSSIASYNDVYYVRGSPLVHADLQRAGAKAAAAVIVLGKRAKTGLLQSSGADGDVESSIIDAEAIFTTMLIELKMDFAKVFTITELADQSNSKFLGTSFQIRQMFTDADGHHANSAPIDDEADGEELSWWECLLLNDLPQQKSEKAIFGLPLYMSGRLLHPELCENMLVQTFYNPSIHKIIRQLVGGPRCTGLIRTFALPKELRRGVTYGDVFHSFASSSFAGICVGIYRRSTQALRSGNRVELRIVLTTPEPDCEMVRDDEIFVLYGVHTLSRAASCIQRLYRNHLRASTQEDPSTPGVEGLNATIPGPFGRSTSFVDPRARIAKYLAPTGSRFDTLSVPKVQRRSLIAQESTSSFRSLYV